MYNLFLYLKELCSKEIDCLWKIIEQTYKTHRKLERCGAVVKCWTQDCELAIAGSTPARTKCCVLEQDILSTLLSTGFYPGRPVRNTQKMRLLQCI